FLMRLLFAENGTSLGPSARSTLSCNVHRPALKMARKVRRRAGLNTNSTTSSPSRMVDAVGMDRLGVFASAVSAIMAAACDVPALIHSGATITQEHVSTP